MGPCRPSRAGLWSAATDASVCLLSYTTRRLQGRDFGDGLAGLLARYLTRRQPEVVERAFAVPVGDQACDLAIAQLEHVCSLCADPSHVEAARSAAPAVVRQHQHALVVERHACLQFRPEFLP